MLINPGNIWQIVKVSNIKKDLVNQLSLPIHVPDQKWFYSQINLTKAFNFSSGQINCDKSTIICHSSTGDEKGEFQVIFCIFGSFEMKKRDKNKNRIKAQKRRHVMTMSFQLIVDWQLVCVQQLSTFLLFSPFIVVNDTKVCFYDHQ